jgi:ABC-type multidrug transport system fused ATPase/permease subunit
MFTFGAIVGQKMFKKGLSALIDAPVNNYYDVTPSGKIISKLQRDIDRLDGGTFWSINGFIFLLFLSFWQLLMGIREFPYGLLMLPPILFAIQYFRVKFRYLRYELERISHKIWAPILQHVTETFRGKAVIRAFGKEELFRQVHEDSVNDDIKLDILMDDLHKWNHIYWNFSLQLLVSFVVFGILMMKGSLDPAFAGLGITVIMGFPGCFEGLTHCFDDSGKNLIPYERMINMTKIRSEADRKSEIDRKL